MAVRTKTEELVGATPEAVDTGYQAGSAAYQQGVKAIEQTVSTLKDGMAQATAGFEKTQTRVKAGMDKAMQTAEEFVAFGQGNLEALVKSGQIWTSGVQDLGKQVAATAQASFEETVAAVKALTGAKSLNDAFELQTNLARATLEKAISESGRLTDASFKLTEQTLAPLAARMSLAVEKFGKPV